VIVAHVGAIGGGAGTAALKIHRGLKQAGVTSWYFAADATGASAHDAVTPLPADIVRRITMAQLLVLQLGHPVLLQRQGKHVHALKYRSVFDGTLASLREV